MSCRGRIDNRGICTMSPCDAGDLWLRYTRAAARDRVATWAALLAAHEGRFIGQCPGSVVMGGLEPCPGLPLPWLEFQAAHGDRCHVPRSALRFG
jgi:hypothetical protein